MVLLYRVSREISGFDSSAKYRYDGYSVTGIRYIYGNWQGNSIVSNETALRKRSKKTAKMKRPANMT